MNFTKMLGMLISLNILPMLYIKSRDKE